jgi:hypothetical protein
MKIAFVFLFTLTFLFNVTITAAVVHNQDKPQKGTWDFKAKLLWKISNAGDSPLVSARSLKVDNNGDIYLFDSKYNKLFAFDKNRKFLFSFGEKGEGPGQFKAMLGLFITKKHIVIHDIGKLHYFDKKGKYVNSVLMGEGLSAMFGRKPKLFLDDNHFLTTISNPRNPAAGEKLEIYDIKTKKSTPIASIGPGKTGDTAAKQGQTRVMVMSFGSGTKSSVIATSKGNNLYYAKTDNYAINVTDKTGKEKLTFSIQGRERKDLPDSEGNSKMKQIQKQLSAQGASLPKNVMDQLKSRFGGGKAAYFSQLHIDVNDNIYVFVTNPGDMTRQQIDIFSPNGQYIYRADIAAPKGHKFLNAGMEMKDNSFHAIVEDNEQENLSLIKYELKLPTIK